MEASGPPGKETHMTNHRTMQVKLTRGEVARLMLICTMLANDPNNGEENKANWRSTHDKLQEQLNAWDKAHGGEQE